MRQVLSPSLGCGPFVPDQETRPNLSYIFYSSINLTFVVGVNELSTFNFQPVKQGRTRRAAPSAGFTLIELLITLVIAALLISMAVPAMQDTLAKNAVESHSKNLNSALSFARSEAITRGSDVSVCPSSDQSTCAGSNVWTSGWIVFVDDGAGGGGVADDAVKNGDEEVLRVFQHTGSNSVIARDSSGADLNGIRFNVRGYALDPADNSVMGTFRLCDRSDSSRYARAVLVEQTGRSIISYDLFDAGGSPGSDQIFEDINGVNLDCTI